MYAVFAIRRCYERKSVFHNEKSAIESFKTISGSDLIQISLFNISYALLKMFFIGILAS